MLRKKTTGLTSPYHLFSSSKLSMSGHENAERASYDPEPKLGGDKQREKSLDPLEVTLEVKQPREPALRDHSWYGKGVDWCLNIILLVIEMIYVFGSPDFHKQCVPGYDSNQNPDVLFHFCFFGFCFLFVLLLSFITQALKKKIKPGMCKDYGPSVIIYLTKFNSFRHF